MNRRPDPQPHDPDLEAKLQAAQKEGRYQPSPSAGAYESPYDYWATSLAGEPGKVWSSLTEALLDIPINTAPGGFVNPQRIYDFGRLRRIGRDVSSVKVFGPAETADDNSATSLGGSKDKMATDNPVTREEIDAKIDS